MPEELQTKLDFYLEAYEQAKQRVTDSWIRSRISLWVFPAFSKRWHST